MENYVIRYCLFLFLLGSTFGRIAFPDLTNDLTLPNSNNGIIKLKSTEGTSLVKEIENVIVDFKEKLKQNLTPCNTEKGTNTAAVKDNAPSVLKRNEDNGTALILTPYIEEDRIDDGRKAAEVDPGLFLGVKSYSGFLTVNKTHNSNMFFWYFPVPDKPVNETPWMVWLQGGPGASSLIGLFDEIGPFTANEEGNLDRNPHTWLRNHSLVFIDNPVGSGYSFTEHKDGLVKDAETYSKHLYSALRQFLELFPEQRAAPLVIAGESYAGKYVPALAMEVHKHKNLPGGDINLRGLMVGNGYVDTRMLAESARPFYEFGLVDKEQVQFLQPMIDSLRRDIEAGRVTKQGRSKWLQIKRKLTEMSGVPVVYNFLDDHAFAAGKFDKFLLKSEVKKALHVGDINFTASNITVTAALIREFLVNPRPWYETLLNHYDVIVLCGQLDLTLSCTAAAEQYRSWQWDLKDEFLNATRCPLRFEERVAGYHKTGGRFTEVVVRGAGHMTPKDAPAPMQWLAAQWTHARPLPLSVCRPPRI